MSECIPNAFRMSDLTQNDDIGPAVTVTCQRGDTLVETYFFFFFRTVLYKSACQYMCYIPYASPPKKTFKNGQLPYLPHSSEQLCMQYEEPSVI